MKIGASMNFLREMMLGRKSVNKLFELYLKLDCTYIRD